ncbi:hypothetical protein BTHE68_36760 [Burkholderia sp. THE68]|uniref:hypothetical protein n=1 Tax=Burkholderia sp. THE68 TaxID=758782 RepID=UPI0013163497|nr:hypothetical protein [Burkholderia sp. THE68]BBU29942.1 hypothetical protein BTHE68_36760 [Burkholderia sp. THE68]
MATSALPTQQPASRPQPASADTKVKQPSFAFPFLKKGRSDADAAVKFTDEHEIYQLLADKEPGGSFLVSKNGFWHGGIHITENGAGRKLDLKQVSDASRMATSSRTA